MVLLKSIIFQNISFAFFPFLYACCKQYRTPLDGIAVYLTHLPVKVIPAELS